MSNVLKFRNKWETAILRLKEVAVQAKVTSDVIGSSVRGYRAAMNRWKFKIVKGDKK